MEWPGMLFYLMEVANCYVEENKKKSKMGDNNVTGHRAGLGFAECGRLLLLEDNEILVGPNNNVV